jgi:TonB family protein
MFGVQPVSQLADLDPDAATPPQTGGEEGVDLTLGTTAGYVSNETYKQRFAAITALELSAAVIDPITLELDGVLPMADDLWNCSKALTERLSQNFGALGGKSVQPVDAAIWAQKLQENYPFHLLRAEQQGTVAVRLTVAKDGKPTFCEVTGYDGPPSFNDTACLQLLRHAKFAPATDAAGNPVASFYSTRVTYRLNN